MKKILIANRGEIALRIMKTAQKMGIKTVAVYSEVDRHSPHVKFADEAVLLGPAPSSESYLVMEKVINAAKGTGADGIHPGYGFLSENATFAQMVEDNGITFIGPKPHAIKVMGNKLAAKEAVRDYDIPMVPGIEEAITDVTLAKKVAKEIGFPILIKASAGGGGKGMRVVENLKDLPEQMQRAISEAQAAFGDGSVFIEKYVGSPRHIEIQVLADTHGNTVHLFERECSVQRRHQKVVEEAPSAVLTPEIREAMGEAAIKVAKACDYVGAGTVEFLLDENKNFYFLEMNTRLQVEHPVSELISGVDLVEQQIKVARGEALTFTQEDLKIIGHALEVRVYAEDPLADFMPSIGTLSTYKVPVGEGIRVDDGFEEGMEVPIYYDPMLSKLITYGKTREEAIQLMIKAIENYKVEGVATTLSFGKFVCEHEAFTSGNFDTHFVKNYYSPEHLEMQYAEERRIAALVALKLYRENEKVLKVPSKNSSNWQKSRV
ncbi:MAG TPA: acetyl-CoA carboxylase biotin carboxylase subunit [Maribacter sp.]|uniref:acetyl-CoA carboxylase biotin carboxylase subunit n=1 Tax=unclassified Maribacter TaxID=2615042 RepID=UPI000EC528B6|nr:MULTISPECIES: acetyl-CoA carboxylase biotin carboxylase subunit [unclassified Maribacter]HAF78713.1 acetyl-CoA carboxylase biotin carboxylase subunit [Maribacter sp.]|tara:strand:- start:834 stop:2306 length:1473 start_codon:yes stop_codon:yes gene_type:complete